MVFSRISELTISILLIGTMISMAPEALAQSGRPFINETFVVPQALETDEFRLRMLTVNDVVKDYDAVMSSAKFLKGIWPGSQWPDGLTLEQNLIDLGWHQKEFQRRRSFAYTVITLDETRVIGCVYIDPTLKRGYDAEVYLWARESAMGSPRDVKLYEVVNEWLRKEWPFENVAFPGRNVDWTAWNAIEDGQR